MNVALYLTLIVFVSVMLGIAIGMYTELPAKQKICYSNSDCSWQITNCCPESAGAMWECVNLKTFEKPECPEIVICPQVVMPKPEESCVCEKGSCVVK